MVLISAYIWPFISWVQECPCIFYRSIQTFISPLEISCRKADLTESSITQKINIITLNPLIFYFNRLLQLHAFHDLLAPEE